MEDATLQFYRRITRTEDCIELKVAKREEDVEKSAEVAIQQIKEKQYIEGLHRKGYTDILGYGIAFYKKTCTIKRVK